VPPSLGQDELSVPVSSPRWLFLVIALAALAALAIVAASLIAG
jgi:hypothetical protein